MAKRISKKKKRKAVRKVIRRRLIKHRSTDKNRYMLNPDFEFFGELKSLILKSSPAEKERLIGRITKLGRIRLAVISGIFLNSSNGASSYETPADLFIVGDDISRKRLRSFLASLEADVGREVKFTLMDKDEFQYRFGMFDRFVRVLLENPHEKIINKLGL